MLAFAKAFLLLLSAVSFVLNAHGQDVLVSGKVSSNDGVPLPGVTVLVKGTTIGTVTDFDGDYSLGVGDEDATLVFSFIGYTSQEVPVNGRSIINLEMTEDVQSLEEVVIVGYNAKKQSELSSSVSVISGEDIRDVTSNSLPNLLQGKAAGVVVSNSSGNPTSEANIVIRGSSSISAGSSPLYVVDGIIGGTANPNDIESVTILKDAAATGLYGSRAANGVIIITTNSGKSGKTRVNVSSTVGFNRATTGNFEVMDAQQLYDYQKTFWDPATWERDRPASLLSQNTNWQELAYRTGITQNHVLSISGGSDKTQFYVSGNYYKEEGTVRHTGNEVINIRTNLTHNINEKLRLSVRLNAQTSRGEDEASGNYGAISAAIRNIPWDNPYNPDGSIKIGTEPGWIGREADNFLHGWQYNFDRNREEVMTGDINLEYYILPNLTFSTYNRASYSHEKAELYYDVRAKAGKGTGELTNNIYYSRNLITSNRLNYDKSFGKHGLSAILVGEAEKNFRDENTLFGKNLAPGLHVMDAAANIIASGSPGNTSENVFSKGLVQVDYNYDNRYFAIGSYILESSSRFGANNRSANFYTLGSSWILSNEGFMKDQELFDMLKIRASYGSTGNASIGDYQSLGLYSFGRQYAGNPASYPYQLANPFLTWEKVKTLDIGLDISIISRISLNLDWYDKTSKGLLLDVPLPYTSGYSSITKNIGSVGNRGVEINLNTINFNKQDFRWETNFNISFNNNKVLALNEGKAITVDNGGADQRISVGRDIYSWYMRKWAGVDPQNGDPLWEVVNTEANGDEVVSLTNVYDEATLQFVGTASPDFTGGINNTITYKRFSLNAFINFVSGNLVYNSMYGGSDGAYQTYNERVLKSGESRWTNPGDIATHPKSVFGGNLLSNKPSSRYLEDGSYIRLRNITLGYDLPERFLNKIQIDNARIFISGDNLWTGTKFSGMDPEVPLSPGGGDIGDTGSAYKYPISRKILFGLNIGF